MKLIKPHKHEYDPNLTLEDLYAIQAAFDAVKSHKHTSAKSILEDLDKQIAKLSPIQRADVIRRLEKDFAPILKAAEKEKKKRNSNITPPKVKSKSKAKAKPKRKS